MRGLVRWAGAVAVVVVLAACGQSDNGGVVSPDQVRHVAPSPPGALHDRLPPAIATAGSLRIGAAVGRAPLLFYGTGTHQIEGLEYDLAQALARQLGVSVVFTDDAYADLGPALSAHRVDLVLSGFVDTKASQRSGIDFVDYLLGRSAVLVRHGNGARIHGPADLCGHRVGVMGGTAQQVAGGHLDAACAKAGHPAVVFTVSGDHGAELASLQAGSLDAVLDDETVARYTSQGSTGTGALDVVGAAVEPLPYGIGVNHDVPGLRDAVQAALRAAIADGSYDAALSHWGGDDAALHTAAVNSGS